MEEKVFALETSFIEKLHDEWKRNFSSFSHPDFLSFINEKYSEDNLKPYLLPGENGVYLDPEIALQINNLDKKGSEAHWDYEASLLLFGEMRDKMGLYQKDNDGNRIPLDAVYATDTRIWNYLSLFRFGQYTIKRWGGSKDSRRIFINRLTNEKVTRHAIMRLYWTANICYDPVRDNQLELLSVLWKTNDFMTQVTERQQSNMRIQTQWMLDFCAIPENEYKLFKEKSIEDRFKYLNFLKLYLAQNELYTMSDMGKKEFNEILYDILESC